MSLPSLLCIPALNNPIKRQDFLFCWKSLKSVVSLNSTQLKLLIQNLLRKKSLCRVEYFCSQEIGDLMWKIPTTDCDLNDLVNECLTWPLCVSVSNFFLTILIN